MPDLTPETLAELRRLYEAAFSVAAPENDWEEWTSKAAEAFPALLNAAAERDRLARLLDEPRRSGCAVEIAGVRIAPCDERGQTADMLAADRLRRELAYMAEARDNSRAEVERLTDLVATVREWIDRRGVNVDDRDDEYMRGYRDAQRHALLDALELRRALDGEADRD